jgi:acetyl-CoA acetyltransferase
MIAAKWEVTRAEQDALGLRSHQLAARPTRALRARDQSRQADGELRVTDQGIRRDTSLKQLTALEPAFKRDGTVTAGNFLTELRRRCSRAADGTGDGRRTGPLAQGRIYDATTAGADPVMMLTGPSRRRRPCSGRDRIKIDDVDPIELKEALASGARSRCSASCDPRWTASTSMAARWHPKNARRAGNRCRRARATR